MTHVLKNPEICQQEIRKPIIILGFPRTGTTLLYNLMALDPVTRAPRQWEMSHLTNVLPLASKYVGRPSIERRAPHPNFFLTQLIDCLSRPPALVLFCGLIVHRETVLKGTDPRIEEGMKAMTMLDKVAPGMSTEMLSSHPIHVDGPEEELVVLMQQMMLLVYAPAGGAEFQHWYARSPEHTRTMKRRVLMALSTDP